MSAIRLATIDDAGQMLDIYSPYCRMDSAVSFEISLPTLAEMKQRIQETLEHYPWLVYAEGETILGYAYAGTHRKRAAYRWSIDVSVYVAPSAHRRGLGKALYSTLFSILRMQGYVNAYAGVTLPNPGSIGLHKSMGFTEVGIYHNVGYKGDGWHDVVWLELALQARAVAPSEPRSLPQILRSQELATVL